MRNATCHIVDFVISRVSDWIKCFDHIYKIADVPERFGNQMWDWKMCLNSEQC